ncbi:MAG: alpha/beta hydrolase [Acidobacteria bacterium]|nr:MAG: alpha/beta hydrolase [Acidobacteriota bacterium]
MERVVGNARHAAEKQFEPHPLLRNPHVATAVAACWLRTVPGSPVTERLFEVEPGTRLLAKCHWQRPRRKHPTLVLVHGLEGSSESPYMRGIAEKAFEAGFNVLRMNQRNCGGTEQLTPTLQDCGLSKDYRSILEELIGRDALPEIFFTGYSAGGNLVLKMAGELGANAPHQLRAVCAVSPSVDLASCLNGSGQARNFLYEWYFLRCLRGTLEKKAKQFPERYRVDALPRMWTLREWHEAVTAPVCGYKDAADYYQEASALRVIGQMRVPALIVTAQDDPFIPFESFRHPAISGNDFITLVAPERGGHCAFISRSAGGERFWAESRVVEFCRQHSEIVKQTSTRGESREHS